MNYFYLKDRTLIIVFVVCLFSFKVSAQDEKTGFKTILQRSIEYKTQKEDSLVCEFNGEKTLVKLLAKDYWEVEKLVTLDCIFDNYSDKLGVQEKAILNYARGAAYNDYDDILKEKFYQDAYIGFESQNDVEGMFFSLSQLFNSKIKSADINLQSSTQGLTSAFDELEELNSQSDFPPIRLSLFESQIRKTLKLGDTLPAATLEKMTKVANTYKITYPSYARNLYSSLGIMYQRQRNLDSALIIKRKALELANPNAQDYPSYFLNLGGTHFYNRNLDSAKYYIRKSYSLIPENPETSYLLSTKNLVAFNLSVIYKQLKNQDSALYYSYESLNASRKLLDKELNQKQIYADKKFELQKKELQLAKKDLEILNKERNQVYFSIGLVFFVILSGILFFTYKKTKQLQVQSSALAKSREDLIQIVSHDLVTPLKVFSTSAKLIPKLLTNKNYKDLKTVQESLSDTIISLESTVTNLFQWNKATEKPEEEYNQVINLKGEVMEIVDMYKPVAILNNVSFKISIQDDITAFLNPNKIGNLLRNVIYNATKHCANHSAITIRLETINDTHFKFCCDNEIVEESREEVERLVEVYNSNDYSKVTTNGFGLELIFRANEFLEGTLEAELTNNRFQLCCILPKNK